MRTFYLFCLLCLILPACAPKSTPGPEASSLLPTGDTYPLTIETGYPEIDPVLAALSTGDRLDLIERFAYLSTACQTVNALGGPPACRAGEPEGTVVSVLPVLSSEGSYIHADAVDTFEGLDVAGIHAIFQNSASAYAEDLFPAGQYTLLLKGAGTVPGYALRVADGKIVRLEYYFDLSAFETVQTRDAAQFILEPVQ